MKLNPENYLTKYRLAQALTDLPKATMTELRQSVSLIQECIAKDSTEVVKREKSESFRYMPNPEIQFSLAIAFWRQGNESDAVEQLKQLIERDHPDFSPLAQKFLIENGIE